MYKIAGTHKYPYGAVSLSDPSKCGLGFDTREKAQSHADSMNSLIDTYDTGSWIWNKEYWKTKPEPWVVFEVQ